MVVNALVMSLIVFRIFKVFREVKATFGKQILGAAHRSALQPIIFVLIESGTLLFSIQLVRLVLASIRIPTLGDTSANNAYPFIIAIHQMLTVSISYFYLYFANNVDRV